MTLKLLIPVFLFKYQIAFPLFRDISGLRWKKLTLEGYSPQPHGVYGHGVQQGISQHQQICGIAEEPSILEITLRLPQ
jgi:hypothetical protein